MAAQLPDVRSDSGFGTSLVNWIAGVVLVYAALFGFGNLLLGKTLMGVGLLALAAFAGAFISWNLSKAGFKTHVQ